MDTKSFLTTLLTTVQDLQAARGTDSVDVAYLGNALHKGGHDWTIHGFERLSAALAQLQQDKLVEILRSEKGALRVRADSRSAGSSRTDLPALPMPPLFAATHGRRFRPLRPAVWFAFVAPLSSESKRLLNRRTGMVWSDATTPPGSPLDWVPVIPVSEGEQRRWAEEFLAQSNVAESETLGKSIQQPDWFRRFPTELERSGPVLVRAWSHLRSARVIDHVTAWAQQNNVADTVLFGDDWTPRKEHTYSAGLSQGSADLRQVLLGALARMRVDELLALPIPARHVIEAIRPDLLQ